MLNRLNSLIFKLILNMYLIGVFNLSNRSVIDPLEGNIDPINNLFRTIFTF